MHRIKLMPPMRSTRHRLARQLHAATAIRAPKTVATNSKAACTRRFPIQHHAIKAIALPGRVPAKNSTSPSTSTICGVKKLVCAPDYPVWGIEADSPVGIYKDNGDGTVADSLTGRTWQQAVPQTPCAGSEFCTSEQAKPIVISWSWAT